MILRQTILILLFLLGFSALCGLGVWQLKRAELKTERYALFTERLKSARVEMSELVSASDVTWRPVILTGTYLGINVLLDNRVLNTKAGYEVFSLFDIKEYGTVLINRGWSSNGGDRSILPKLPLPRGEVNLSGYFGPIPASGITFHESVSNIERLSAQNFRVQHINWSEIGAVLEGVSLKPFIIYIDAGGPGALKIERKTPGSGADKHQAYAVQWFCMAIVLAIIGLINYRRR